MVDDAFKKREREKARALRKSRWWQTKLSQGFAIIVGNLSNGMT